MRRIVIVPLALALTAGAAGAQEPAPGRWSAEAVASVAFPTGQLGDADLGTGSGFELNARYRIMPHLALYAGWDWHHFSSDAELDGGRADIEDTGYAFGLRFEHPFARRASYWLRTGGIANHIELENDDGDIVFDSGHGLGFELGAGLTMKLRDRVSVTPGARYRSLSRDVELGGTSSRVNLDYLSVGLGFAYEF